jgi:hypothetical protein
VSSGVSWLVSGGRVWPAEGTVTAPSDPVGKALCAVLDWRRLREGVVRRFGSETIWGLIGSVGMGWAVVDLD